jgi:hypothetical protein
LEVHPTFTANGTQTTTYIHVKAFGMGASLEMLYTLMSKASFNFENIH